MMRKIIILLCFMLCCYGCTTKNETETPKEVHCSFYNEKYSVEDVIAAFDEVVLRTEYSDGNGNSSLVQKWEGPIYYTIEGCSDNDLKVLEDLFAKLNTVEGFPGFEEADGLIQLRINFYDDKQFYDEMGHIVEGFADGAVQYWYDTEMNYIYEGHIGYRNTMDDSVRISVLKEEVINLLGITDTETREDSITYQYSSTNNELSEMDWIIIHILYHNDIKSSMNSDECHEVIRKIYY